MGRSGIIIIIVLSILISYTGYKVNQALHLRKLTALALSILIFVFMIGWQFLYRLKNFSPSSYSIQFLAWSGSILLGVWATFILLSLPFDLMLLLRFIIENTTGQLKLSHERRALLFQWIPLGLLGTSGLMTSLGLRQALRGAQIKPVTIEIENLPIALKGLRIAQFTDLHVSPLIGEDYVKDVAQKIAGLKADVIVFTGDFADGTPEDLATQVAPLASLKAPLGSYYITGNHEYYWNADVWINKARELGFTPLINENRILNFNGTDFMLAGVTDTSGERFSPEHKSDPRKAVLSQKEVDLKILLAHRPESCYEAADSGFQLQLSGHTHAGQFFPFNMLMPLAHKYYKGLNRHKGMWLYVNQGTGFWGPPHRFGVSSEITLITLSKK